MPVVHHSIVTGNPNDMIVQQVPHYSQELPMILQQVPEQPSGNSEFMARRLPIYNDNTINPNNNYINEMQRLPEPEPIEDKRLYYQKMLWHKLRRDAMRKKQAKYNQEQTYGIIYQDVPNNQYVPDYTYEEQQQQRVPQIVQEEQQQQQVQRPTVVFSSPPDQLTNGQAVNYQQQDRDQTQVEQNENINGDAQEQITSNDSGNNNENTNQMLLKNYLSYLRQKDSANPDDISIDVNRSGRQYEVVSSTYNSRVPDVIRGYMPAAPLLTNSHTNGQKMQDMQFGSDEPLTSSSQVSYAIERPVNNLRMVSSEMSFGQRLAPKEYERKPFGYGYKSYDHYQEDKAKRMKFYDIKTNLVEKPMDIDVGMGYDEDVLVVTADPRQRQVIEKLEEQQFPRRHHKTLSDDWTGFNAFVPKQPIEAPRRSRHFRIDESRIEYNGWKPLRQKEEKSIEDDSSALKEEMQLNLQMSASEPVPAIVPIIGRVSDSWKTS